MKLRDDMEDFRAKFASLFTIAEQISFGFDEP